MKYILLINLLVTYSVCTYSLENQIRFDYDDLNRLTKINYGNGTIIEYSYDAVGNRTAKIINSSIRAYAVSGKIRYYYQNKPVQNTEVHLTGQAEYRVQSNSNGDYNLPSVFSGQYSSTASKADDISRGLSATDASQVARHALGINPFNCYQKIAADVTGDGYISAMDASRIARCAIGIITNFGSGNPHWRFVAGQITSCSNWPPIQFNESFNYSPLSSNLTNQDFIALRMGDVTGNWQPDAGALAKVENISNSEIIHLSPGAHAADLHVHLELHQYFDVEGIDLSIEYDPQLLSFQRAELIADISSESYNVMINDQKEGEVYIAIYATSENLYSGSGIIGNLLFNIISENGFSSSVNIKRFEVNEHAITTRVFEIETTLPTKYALYQNYPNPFNPETTICYDLPKRARVLLSIYNIEGQLVTTLINGDQSAGYQKVMWNANNIPSGVYFYKFLAKPMDGSENFMQTNKLILLK